MSSRRRRNRHRKQQQRWEPRNNHNNNHNTNQHQIQAQKSKLRTSMDVYHRLTHDKTLPIDTKDVMIGYTDHKFSDIQHKPLYEWILIDKGGDIPMHHIVYFKYFDLILWDKRNRLDRLYGSGNTKASQLLANVLQNNDSNSSCQQYTKNMGDYPDKPKIVANPRKMTCTDPRLMAQGIKTIQYVYSFGIIPYRFELIMDELTPVYLIIQTKYNKEWGFPKGHFEPNKESNHGYDTAKREFEEETGISFTMCNNNGKNGNIVSVDWHNPYIQQYDFQRKDRLCKKWTVLFSAELSLNANATIIRPKEISDIRWMTFKQFCKRNKHSDNKDVMQKLETKLRKELVMREKKQYVDEVEEKKNDNKDNLKHSGSWRRKQVQRDYNGKYDDILTVPKSQKRGKDLKEMSITLAWILRHGADHQRIDISKDGWVDMEELLNTESMMKHQSTFIDVVDIVKHDKKSRYSMIRRDNRWKCRANQGHSMDVIDSNQLLTKLTIDDLKEFKNICHGTYYEAYDMIKKTGLSKMSRNHIHFAADDDMEAENVKSGMRRNCELLIYVDVAQCIEDGIIFYKSSNNVVLTEGDDKGYVPSKYFIKVVQFKDGKPAKMIYHRND